MWASVWSVSSSLLPRCSMLGLAVCSYCRLSLPRTSRDSLLSDDGDLVKDVSLESRAVWWVGCRRGQELWDGAVVVR